MRVRDSATMEFFFYSLFKVDIANYCIIYSHIAYLQYANTN